MVDYLPTGPPFSLIPMKRSPSETLFFPVLCPISCSSENRSTGYVCLYKSLPGWNECKERIIPSDCEPGLSTIPLRLWAAYSRGRSYSSVF